MAKFKHYLSILTINFTRSQILGIIAAFVARLTCSGSQFHEGPLAQLVEQWIFNPLVGRSSRPRPTI